MSDTKRRVLVTGGAGYIGSHAVKLLIENGFEVTVIDNLARGHRRAVHPDAHFFRADLRDTPRIADIIEQEKPGTVLHFAAYAYVGESVEDPLPYYDNNVGSTVSLLSAVRNSSVSRFVFSSTCATYGEPSKVPITELTPQCPINPYGRSKLVAEQILTDFQRTCPSLAIANLRYFNVAGCAADGSLGEDHRPETHLIPILMEAALGKRSSTTVFGTDYPTPDGTCIRDYVHVDDLCRAHLLAMESLQPGDNAKYNVGIGRGYSVQEVLDAAFRVTGRTWRVHYGQRRAGDPPQLFADASKIQRELGWAPQFNNIESIIESAWNWFRLNPDGYGGDD